MPSCSFCDRQAYADAEISSLDMQWLYVCKSHFIQEQCTFREGKAEFIISNAPQFNGEHGEFLIEFEQANKECLENVLPRV